MAGGRLSNGDRGSAGVGAAATGNRQCARSGPGCAARSHSPHTASAAAPAGTAVPAKALYRARISFSAMFRGPGIAGNVVQDQQQAVRLICLRDQRGANHRIGGEVERSRSLRGDDTIQLALLADPVDAGADRWGLAAARRVRAPAGAADRPAACTLCAGWHAAQPAMRAPGAGPGLIRPCSSNRPDML